MSRSAKLIETKSRSDEESLRLIFIKLIRVALSARPFELLGMPLFVLAEKEHEFQQRG